MSPWVWAFTLAVWFHLFLQGLGRIVGALTVYFVPNPISSKRIMVAAKGAFAFLFVQFASVATSEPLLSLGLGGVLLLGSDLRSHLKRRTTAAYSTSDLYHQRFFNLTVMFQVLGLGAGTLFQLFGVSLFRDVVGKIPPPPLSLATLLAGIAVYDVLRNAFVLFSHWKTLGYLLGNYLRGLKEGRLKRFW